MAYTALKPCCFAGQRFKIGENVPDEVIHPGAAKNLVQMGIIAKQGGTTADLVSTQGTAPQDSTINVVIHAEEGDLPLELTAEGLQSVVDILTATATDAEPIIEQMTDSDALILLHIADSRKTIRAAAEARAKTLNEATESEETENDEAEDGEGEGEQ